MKRVVPPHRDPPVQEGGLAGLGRELSRGGLGGRIRKEDCEGGLGGGVYEEHCGGVISCVITSQPSTLGREENPVRLTYC